MPGKDTRNFDPQTGKGMTSQETADAASSTGQPGYTDRSHPSAAAQPKMPGPKIQPNAPGGKTYGPPVGPVILK